MLYEVITYQPMADDFEESLDYGDIYDKMDTILGLTVENGYHVKSASDSYNFV